MHNPFARKRPNPKRTEPRRTGDRVRLDREGKEALRTERWELDGRRCVGCGKPLPLDGDLQTRAHLAHIGHGPRKTDTIDGTRTKCYECHIVKEHGGGGGKPVPRKAGRTMNIKEANDYWHGQKCFCERWKKPKESFCSECLPKLSAQLRYDLENAMGKDYLAALALAEQALLMKEKV